MLLTKFQHVLNATLLTFWLNFQHSLDATLWAFSWSTPALSWLGFGGKLRRLNFNSMIDPCLKDFNWGWKNGPAWGTICNNALYDLYTVYFYITQALVIRPNPFLPSGSSFSIYIPLSIFPHTTVRLRPCSSCLARQQAMQRQAIRRHNASSGGNALSRGNASSGNVSSECVVRG